MKISFNLIATFAIVTAMVIAMVIVPKTTTMIIIAVKHCYFY